MKRELIIRCPLCSTIGNLMVSDSIIKNITRGIVAVNILEKQVCQHAFIAYIDRDMNVRDSFAVDFQVQLPDVETRRLEKLEVRGIDDIDIDLIKLNLKALTLTFLLRGCVLNKEALYLNDEVFLHIHLINFFKFVFSKSFEIEFTVKKKEDYNKKLYKDFLILDDKKVIRDKNNLLNSKRIKIERSFVQNFLSERDSNLSLIMLKNDIQKAFEISKKIMNLIENYKGKEKLGKNELIRKLTESSKIKISVAYLEFILDIINKYFGFDLSVISNYMFPALGI